MKGFERVVVIGVGLIGGSFSLALKEKKLCGQVVGVGRSAANLKLALERGAIDSIEADVAAAVRGGDLVLLATPVAQFSGLLPAIEKALKPGAIVSDAGSTKRDVVAAARAALGVKSAQFVPAHPIAGAELSGAAAANPQLFRGRRLVLTPLAENKPQDLDAIADLWSAIGAQVSRMTPEEHDQVFAAVSHLPHLLAYALVSELSERPDAAKLFGYAAGGFRDFTRIASSQPEMWRDICVANRDQLLRELHLFENKLETIGTLLEAGDAASLQQLFAAARAAREQWLNGGGSGRERE
ncbi:MAG: prephenate dehydrogenase/arogenate dehydrogenase family protein [Betaproteobacteria bacterium]|nr:prephenate dehydrogenase/arogenate dehydrogenase family protein [Betaproteobacteria bacterium]